MLPNRTYNELNESCFSQTELSEEAKLRAGLSARKNRRSSLQLTADRKALIAIYKKCRKGRSNGAHSKHCSAIFI